MGHLPKEININMTPKEDKIFGAFSECPLAPLKGVPTYEYMTNLNVYPNSCSSAVDCTLGCGTLGYLVLTAQPAVSNTHCGTEFVTLRNPGIHPVMPDPAPTAVIFSKLVRTHKHELCLFNEYHEVDSVCKKVVRKLIPEKFYKSLSSHIIGFVKVRSLEILTHLITEYAELKEEDMQDIDWKMKELISGENIFEEFVKKTEWNQEAVAVQNLDSPYQIVSMAYANIKNAGYTKTISENGLVKHEVTKHGATSRLTSLGPSRRPKDPQQRICSARTCCTS